MTREEAIQTSLRHNKGKRYLEIGIRTGKTLFKVECAEKVGVDPDYDFPFSQRWKRLTGAEKSKVYKMTSDDFFKKNPDGILDKGFDVIFVDGLHTYGQTLKDVENSLLHLNPNGVIILHDCSPATAARAVPVQHSFDELKPQIRKKAIEGWDGAWNGDVWKTIVHLRATRPDLEVFTIDADHGLGVVKVGKPTNTLDISIDELKQSTYDFLEANRQHLLNLHPGSYLQEFLEK